MAEPIALYIKPDAATENHIRQLSRQTESGYRTCRTAMTPSSGAAPAEPAMIILSRRAPGVGYTIYDEYRRKTSLHKVPFPSLISSEEDADNIRAAQEAQVARGRGDVCSAAQRTGPARQHLLECL